jgi:hypothetical protein
MGVYARDELPKLDSFPCCFVLNTAKRSHPGKHWLAFYYDSKSVCNFFDSFGNDPEFFNLKSYISKNSDAVIWNKKPIQSFQSENCGYYCILFLILRSSGYSMEKFCDLFYDLTFKNDEMIEKFKIKF